MINIALEKLRAGEKERTRDDVICEYDRRRPLMFFPIS